MQPEVDLGGDHSLFTRHTAPFSPKRVAEILRLVAVGPDLTDDQTMKAKNLISEFTDCFTLSVSEVITIPGATHKIHIPPGVTFPKKIPHQRPLTEPQRKYLSNAIDELLAADIIEPIRPEDVKCASPITLAQKPHENTGLSLDELRYKGMCYPRIAIGRRYRAPTTNTEPHGATKTPDVAYLPKLCRSQ